MKNAPFYLLVGVVSIIIGLLILGIYFSLTQGGAPENAAEIMCGIILLAVAFLFWELTMKPGVYTRRRKIEEEEEEKREEKPKSP